MMCTYSIRNALYNNYVRTIYMIAYDFTDFKWANEKIESLKYITSTFKYPHVIIYIFKNIKQLNVSGMTSL